MSLTIRDFVAIPMATLTSEIDDWNVLEIKILIK